MIGPKYTFAVLSMAIMCCFTVNGFCQDLVSDNEHVYIVNNYRYETGSSEQFADVGQAQCGDRCNAMSVDYQNYVTPPGWRLIQLATEQEVEVQLNNDLLDGRCVCVADEYVVKVNTLYMSK